MLSYQFGENAHKTLPENARIKRSKKTGRIRTIYEGKEIVATGRAHDHFIIPKKAIAARLLAAFPKPKLRVILGDDPQVVSCVEEGKSVFAKFVSEVGSELRAGDECFVVDKDDNLLGIGTLAPREIRDFTRGVAVKTR